MPITPTGYYPIVTLTVIRPDPIQRDALMTIIETTVATRRTTGSPSTKTTV